MMERFSRIIRMSGKEGFERLQNSTITIVGLGAVGGFCLEALARSGIGHFRLFDFDKINESNINRQILALDSTLGQLKAEAAFRRVKDINPNCHVEIFPLFVHEESMEKVLNSAGDLLIDAIDSVTPKALLLERSWKAAIPTYSSMGAARKSDPSKIRTDDLMKTRACPLARQMRKYLRNRGVGKGITAVYSEEIPVKDPSSAEEAAAYQAGEYQRGRPRQPLGSYPAITAIFGLTLAQLAVNRLLSDFPGK